MPPEEKTRHELIAFRPCTFGDGGYYYHDGADRAICSCKWKSAAVQRNQQALIALWKIHRDTENTETQCPKCEHKFIIGDKKIQEKNTTAA